jgi:hypothetical protein
MKTFTITLAILVASVIGAPMMRSEGNSQLDIIKRGGVDDVVEGVENALKDDLLDDDEVSNKF